MSLESDNAVVMLSDSIGLWACDSAVGNRYKAQCSVIGNMKNDALLLEI